MITMHNLISIILPDDCLSSPMSPITKARSVSQCHYRSHVYSYRASQTYVISLHVNWYVRLRICNARQKTFLCCHRLNLSHLQQVCSRRLWTFNMKYLHIGKYCYWIDLKTLWQEKLLMLSIFVLLCKSRLIQRRQKLSICVTNKSKIWLSDKTVQCLSLIYRVTYILAFKFHIRRNLMQEYTTVDVLEYIDPFPHKTKIFSRRPWNDLVKTRTFSIIKV